MKDTLSPCADLSVSHWARRLQIKSYCISQAVYLFRHFPDVLVYPQGDVHAADKTGIYFFTHSMDWFWGRLFVIGLYMKE